MKRTGGDNLYVLNVAPEFDLEVLARPPEPVTIDGVTFDPIRHSADWRRQDESTKARLEYEALQRLHAVLAAVPAREGRWQAIAARLNAGRGGQDDPGRRLDHRERAYAGGTVGSVRDAKSARVAYRPICR